LTFKTPDFHTKTIKVSCAKGRLDSKPLGYQQFAGAPKRPEGSFNLHRVQMQFLIIAASKKHLAAEKWMFECRSFMAV